MKIDRESKSVGEKSRAEQVKEILRRVQRASPERKQFVPKRTRSPIQKRTAETYIFLTKKHTILFYSFLELLIKLTYSEVLRLVYLHKKKILKKALRMKLGIDYINEI